MQIENTLFVGNGFSKSLFNDVPSWNGLFEGAHSSIKNNTFLYELHRLQQPELEEAVIKENLIEKLMRPYSEENLNNQVRDLDDFGLYLKRYTINNIITTNYDTGVEFVLSRCGYVEQKKSGVSAERVYSIRTYKVFYDEEADHTIKLWKIHGDISRIPSITLGFDQYCGSLAKLTQYIKGQYESTNKKVQCKKHMKDKCNDNDFDGISWAELFFNSNVYIVGFGMDFSEIDIWWLINKRVRYKREGIRINNTITYLYNPDHDRDCEKTPIYAALDSFDVIRKSIQTSELYFNELFSTMQEQPH